MSSSMSGQPASEVFLSFRGPDTRNNFADFLYTWLTYVGISVFRDEEDLETGREINPKLIQAIQQCKISIPVISKDYASSNSCLMELQKMVERMDGKNHTIIPIFYHVNPSDVHNCTGTFATEDEHQKCAFRKIAALAGLHVKESDKYHTPLIKQIVHKVEQMLKKRNLDLPKQLVDLYPHVQDIMAKLQVGYRKGELIKVKGTCKKVLIYGIPGVGKTVLAKCVYNKLNHMYDACSFLEEIPEEIARGGVLSVQNRLKSQLLKKFVQEFNSPDEALSHFRNRLHRMKVLLLLDNVEDREQLRALVGGLDWLCPGSTVIVTSRRDDVLENFESAEKFGLRTMQNGKALQLFCRHAFKKDSPPTHFEKLSKEIVAAIDGLPRALVKIGGFLSQEEDCGVWGETPAAWQQASKNHVQADLFKSYKTLSKNEQDIFLDIACFFSGKDRRIPYYMWENSQYLPYLSLLSLRAVSFIEIGEDENLCMHGILKTFGQEIVKNENRNEPEQRSRLWDHNALEVLRQKKGTGKVIALGLEFSDGSTEDKIFESDKFHGLHNLRFLRLDKADVGGNFGDRLSSLRWLDWQGCPKILHVQSLNLNLQELLILDLSGSQVDKDWRGWELLKQARKLKVLKLTGCVQLFATPKFPASMSLERLILEGSSKLAVSDTSFENLKKLVSLNMKGCSLLIELPELGPMKDLGELVIDGTSISRINFQEGSMMTLKYLSARDCKDLTYICNSIGYLKSLKYLALDGSGIRTLPMSIKLLNQLQILSLKNCGSLPDLPDGIGNLSSLQSLDLSHTAIPELPPSIKDLKAMKVLRMRDTLIRKFPEAILNLEKLEEIDFSFCRFLEGGIPDDISRLSSLAILKLPCSGISGLPLSFRHLSQLRELDIS